MKTQRIHPMLSPIGVLPARVKYDRVNHVRVTVECDGRKSVALVDRIGVQDHRIRWFDVMQEAVKKVKA